MPERMRCYCSNIGTMSDNNVFTCKQCESAGREGAPWPGDYYKRTGLFRDRSGEFNPSVRPARRIISPARQISPPHVGVYSPQEIDSSQTLYGNLILRRRDDLADLCSLYNFKVFVEVGTDLGVYAERLLRRSSTLRMYCVDPWLPYSEIPGDRTGAKEKCLERLEPFKDRVTVLEMPSLEAVSRISERIDVVYIDGAHDEENVWKDINAWWGKLRIGGLLAGHDYNLEAVSSCVRRFSREKQCDVTVINEQPVSDGKDCSGGWTRPTWFMWKRM